MEPEARMLYKLIILYFLDRVDFPISNAQLTNFILDKDYTNYFNVQETLGDLIEDDYVRSDKINDNHVYLITEAGHEALSFFNTTLSPVIKDEIDAFIQEHAFALREETSTFADYHVLRKNEYVTRLQVWERGTTIIDLNLNVSSEEAADIICKNWRQKSSDIYAFILTNLMAD